MMKCDYCGMETRVDSYEIGGVVDCGKCRDIRTPLEKANQRIAELEKETLELETENLMHLEEIQDRLQPKIVRLESTRVSDELLCYLSGILNGKPFPTMEVHATHVGILDSILDMRKEHTDGNIKA